MEGDKVAVKVAGALKGVVFVESYNSSVANLRTEVARLLGLNEPGAVKMISGGRHLQGPIISCFERFSMKSLAEQPDDGKCLKDYNISATSRVLLTMGAAARAELAGQEAHASEEESRAAKLDRLKAAADKMVSRGDGRGLSDRYEFSLENQDGTQVHLSESDRRGVVLGLALHEKGRASMEAGNWQAALGEFLLAEESFNLVSAAVLEGIDNVAMLLLDIVWCCYKLRDISRLGVCSERLASARRMLAKAHGSHQERLRLLHGGFSPEQAIYVRLELLEGVVAYHSGVAAAAQQHLDAAKARWQRLQLSPAALLQLAEMGYSEVESTRALRFSGGDLAAAVDFLTEQRKKQQERRSERKRQRAWLTERKQFGKTPSGKYLDEQSLSQLCQLGYDKALAAEALRQADNDAQAALDVLGDPVQRGALQLGILAQQMLEEEQGPQSVKASCVRRLVAMGFKEKAARIALKATNNSIQEALEQLAAMGEAARDADAAAGAVTPEAAAEGDGKARVRASDGAAGPSAAAAASGADGGRGSTQQAAAAGDETGAAMDEDGAGAGGSSAEEVTDEVDFEMEDQLISAVQRKGKDDPLSAYDLDVSEDGEAIQLYISLLLSK